MISRQSEVKILADDSVSVIDSTKGNTCFVDDFEWERAGYDGAKIKILQRSQLDSFQVEESERRKSLEFRVGLLPQYKREHNIERKTALGSRISIGSSRKSRWSQFPLESWFARNQVEEWNRWRISSFGLKFCHNDHASISSKRSQFPGRQYPVALDENQDSENCDLKGNENLNFAMDVCNFVMRTKGAGFVQGWRVQQRKNRVKKDEFWTEIFDFYLI